MTVVEMWLNTQNIRYTAQHYGRNHVQLHDLVHALWVWPAEPACQLWHHATSRSKQADGLAQSNAAHSYYEVLRFFFGKYPAMDIRPLLPECHGSEIIFDWSSKFQEGRTKNEVYEVNVQYAFRYKLSISAHCYWLILAQLPFSWRFCLV